MFLFLLNSSGAVALFVYLMITLSEIRMRRRMEAEEPGRLRIRMRLYLYLSIATAVLMVIVILSLAVHSDTRSQLALTAVTVVVCFGLFYVTRFVRSRTIRSTERTGGESVIVETRPITAGSGDGTSNIAARDVTPSGRLRNTTETRPASRRKRS